MPSFLNILLKKVPFYTFANRSSSDSESDQNDGSLWPFFVGMQAVIVFNPRVRVGARLIVLN